MTTHPRIVDLPALGDIVGHGARHLAEHVLAPVVVFYAVLVTAGQRGAFVGALAWMLLAVATRCVVGRPVPIALWLGVLLLAARTAIGLATGSAFLYFLQPSLSNFVVAAVLLASLPRRQSLLARLAGDFCALPTDLVANPRLRRFFVQVSLLWALVFCANGALTIWALVTIPLRQFLLVSTAVSIGVVVFGACVSLVWFRRSLRGVGLQLRMGAAA